MIKKDDATGTVPVTVPADKVADGSTVTGRVDSATGLSPEVEVKGKAPQPSEFSHHVRDNGDEVITLPQNADSVTINYPVSDANVKTVTISKGQDGTWTAPADSDLVIKKDDTTGSFTVTVPADKISGNRTITASAKAGSGAGESKERTFTTTVVERQAPTVSEVTVAANGTLSAEQINAAVTAPKKVSAVAAEALKQVAAGSNTEIPVTVTYADGSTETVQLAVYSKQVTPSTVGFQQKDNGDAVLTPPTNADKVTITYTNQAGAQQTVKLSKTGGNWSVTEGDGTVLSGNQVVLPYKGLDRTQVIGTSATAGSDKYMSEVASQDYTVPEHRVTIAPIIRSNSDTLLSTAVEDAVTVTNKENVEKQGNLPTGIGKHTINAKVTYKDQSEEMVEIPYTIKPDAPSISTSIGTAG
ncbi:Rib/alpha-like domain-containing protein, partial [Streptococcus pneumoniae]|uniref:Rib/alpha-like domain-containing protein n=1 Tax=Streptococcus pneumoniae TaxID=1313 RepID=UPI00186A4569